MAKPDLSACAQLDLNALVAAFPDSADTLLLDRYLVDHGTASARLFRVYQPTPAHFHRHSDEHLYVLSGTGTVWLGDASKAAPFGPGTFLFFPRETVHATPAIGPDSVVFLAIDTPRRSPEDIVFVEPESGDAAGFIHAVDDHVG